MDSLSLQSRPLVNLRDHFQAKSTTELKSELADLLGLSANNLLHLAIVVSILEERGEDLSAIKSGFLMILRRIASGQLLPEVAVMFAGEPEKILKASTMPVMRQIAVVEGLERIPSRDRSGKRNNRSLEIKPNVEAIALAGSPKDVGEMAAELISSCNDSAEALAVFCKKLSENGLLSREASHFIKKAVKASEEEKIAEPLKNGDINLEDFKRLVCKLSIKYGADKKAVEDSWQYAEGWIALVNAKKNFKPDNATGASFFTYAHVCIERRFWMVYKRDKRGSTVKTFQFSQIGDEGDGGNVATVVDPEFNEDATQAADMLSFIKDERTLRMVEKHIMKSMTLQEIGKEESISKERVRQIVESGLEIIRKAVAVERRS